jgi:hypothetical protein
MKKTKVVVLHEDQYVLLVEALDLAKYADIERAGQETGRYNEVIDCVDNAVLPSKTVWVLEGLETFDRPTNVFVGVFSSEAKAKEFMSLHRSKTSSGTRPDGSTWEYENKYEYTLNEVELDSATDKNLPFVDF